MPEAPELAPPVLDEREAELLRKLDEVMGGIKDWGLVANHDELGAAVHVLQGFIIQHMLHRVAPEHWNSWYASQGARSQLDDLKFP